VLTAQQQKTKTHIRQKTLLFSGMKSVASISVEVKHMFLNKKPLTLDNKINRNFLWGTWRTLAPGHVYCAAGSSLN